jgi:hypothetical protein
MLSNPESWAVDVEENRPGTLKVGGALREIITVQRDGNTLLLVHEVTGTAGGTYTDQADLMHPPGFAIYKGDARIASGTFEYG